MGGAGGKWRRCMCEDYAGRTGPREARRRESPAPCARWRSWDCHRRIAIYTNSRAPGRFPWQARSCRAPVPPRPGRAAGSLGRPPPARHRYRRRSPRSNEGRSRCPRPVWLLPWCCPLLAKPGCQRDGLRDIACLAILVPARQQDDESLASADEINAVSRSMVDPQFRYTGSDRPNITRIAQAQPVNANLNAGPGTEIAQTVEPCFNGRGLADLDHRDIVSLIIQNDKDWGHDARGVTVLKHCSLDVA